MRSIPDVACQYHLGGRLRRRRSWLGSTCPASHRRGNACLACLPAEKTAPLLLTTTNTTTSTTAAHREGRKCCCAAGGQPLVPLSYRCGHPCPTCLQRRGRQAAVLPQEGAVVTLQPQVQQVGLVMPGGGVTPAGRVGWGRVCGAGCVGWGVWAEEVRVGGGGCTGGQAYVWTRARQRRRSAPVRPAAAGVHCIAYVVARPGSSQQAAHSPHHPILVVGDHAAAEVDGVTMLVCRRTQSRVVGSCREVSGHCAVSAPQRQGFNAGGAPGRAHNHSQSCRVRPARTAGGWRTCDALDPLPQRHLAVRKRCARCAAVRCRTRRAGQGERVSRHCARGRGPRACPQPAQRTRGEARTPICSVPKARPLFARISRPHAVGASCAERMRSPWRHNLGGACAWMPTNMGRRTQQAPRALACTLRPGRPAARAPPRR